MRTITLTGWREDAAYIYMGLHKPSYGQLGTRSAGSPASGGKLVDLAGSTDSPSRMEHRSWRIRGLPQWSREAHKSMDFEKAGEPWTGPPSAGAGVSCALVSGSEGEPFFGGRKPGIRQIRIR